MQKKVPYRSKKLVFLPLFIILLWLAVAIVGGPYFAKINEVSGNDLSTFLPKNSESTKVNQQIMEFRNSNSLPAIVVFESNNKLSAQQIESITKAGIDLSKINITKDKISPPVLSNDGKAIFIVIPIDSEYEPKDVLPKLRDVLNTKNIGVNYKFTGPAVFSEDLSRAFGAIDGLLLVVALGVVFVILLFVYKSPILPVVTLLGSVLALTLAIFIVWHVAKLDIVQMNGQVQGILFILVIGATTDYSLLYISRYREELTKTADKWEATKATWRASWEPVVAAGGTVTLGLLCLLASDLGSNRSLGPVGGIGVMLAVISALTFLPASLLLFGKYAFWPKIPKAISRNQMLDYNKNHPIWAKVGKLVAKYPRKLWASLTILIVIAIFFVPQLKADGVAQSELVIGRSEARDGQALIDKHFPSGSGSPVQIITKAKNLNNVVKLLDENIGVDAVSFISDTTDNIPIPIGVSGSHMEQSGKPIAPFTPKIINNEVWLQATLKNPASSVEARDTVAELRDTIQSEYPDTVFGGVSAIQLDTNNTSERDLKVIIPLILLAVTTILMLLLRAVVAPLILLATTILSFGATLGISAIVFNNIWQFPGGDPAVIIFGFVFLVALGIDYNIFLMSRVREETKKIGVEKGTIKALVVTGGVITSAGIVLASTFTALSVIPILFLVQIAFVVAFGVILDTIIVRSLIVPGLTLDIGKKMWWPSKLAKKNNEKN